MAYQSLNPFDGRLSQTFEELSDNELDFAISRAATCFDAWRRTSFAERADAAAKAAAIMRARVDQLARPATLEMGKLFDLARGEVVLGADIHDDYAKNAEHFLAPQRLAPSSGEAEVESAPIGVLLGVEPCNFQYDQLARFAAPNLIAGNVVMVQHAGCVSQCAVAFERLWLEAGAPEGADTNLMISSAQVLRVIDDPRIKGVAFTGSLEAGKIVASRAGLNMKKSVMELGGSDAFIVLEDVDLDKTVEWAVWGKMKRTGQCCVAARRFIVADALADRFVHQFQSARTALVPGDPMDNPTTFGPLSTEAALIKLVDQGRRAVVKGATLVMGRGSMDRPGAFMEPTILTDARPDNAGFKEEFFGPVAIFFRVKNEDEAIAHANKFEFSVGRVRLHERCRARPTRCKLYRYGGDGRRSSGLDFARPAVRRHQELRLWPGTFKHGDPGIRQHEARSGCAD
jgi:succinate-semialdehyde dehydrogenase/glutarate-semialdehyde dehydrogenase